MGWKTKNINVIGLEIDKLKIQLNSLNKKISYKKNEKKFLFEKIRWKNFSFEKRNWFIW